MSNEFNKKLEQSPWEERVQPEYPWVSGHSDVNGRSRMVYSNPEQPEKASSETINHDGSFQTQEVSDKKKGLHNQLKHEERSYVGGGSSGHTDGQKDRATESNERKNVKQDKGSSAAGDGYDGTGGKKMSGSGDSSFHNNTGGNSFQTSNGDIVSQHKGNKHQSHEGDSVNSITGNKVTMIKSGDFSVHVQSGNMDMQASGKGRIKTDGDLLLKSDSKITLEVGDMKIEITADMIKMFATFVSIAGKTYIGQESFGEKNGPLVVTAGGAAKQAYAKV